MENFTIDLIKTADYGDVLTAYDSEKNPVCSLIDFGNGWEVFDSVEGKKQETMDECECDLNDDLWFEKLHEKMYELTILLDID